METAKYEINFVTKRSGKQAHFDWNKLKRVIYWATKNNEDYTNLIINDLNAKFYEGQTTTELTALLIRTAANKISPIFSDFEYVAARFLLLKAYKETWNEKIKNGDLHLPDLAKVINFGLKDGSYSEKAFNYDENEIAELNDYLKQERDYLFTYKALTFFYSKYCFKSKNHKHFELPQFAYMRVAMSLFVNEDKNVRLNLVKRFYDALSLHEITVATPIMLNAGTKREQLSSCVLSVVADDTESIMQTNRNLALYSKNKGGTALDISYLRASGSLIHTSGVSSGPVPFLKITEAIMKAFNQGGNRPGACCIYFNWWHWNIKELVVLKNNNGTEENRARFLKYGVKVNALFIDRALKNEDVSLFDPIDVPMLLTTSGKEFEKWYLKYENDAKIKQTKVKALDLLSLIMKERAETGNIYLYHIENVQNGSLLKRYINSSNLCTEITLPTTYSVFENERLNVETGQITREYKSGEIALCNLASVNLIKWKDLRAEEKANLSEITVRALDNTIDVSYYPVLEAEYSNKNYRFLGIGVNNYANYLASKQIIIDSNEALEETAALFDDLTFNLIKASVDLAKIKGPFKRWKETEWAEGVLPVDKANKNALALTNYQPDYKKWDTLRADLKKTGIRNGTVLAIAPTATSGKAINATEACEPVQMLSYKEDGMISVPTLAPNLKKNRKYYKTAVNCDQFMLLKLAAIRQIYIDQAQSVNVYFKKVNSATDFIILHAFGFALGMKTFYYCKTEKGDGEICESCS